MLGTFVCVARRPQPRIRAWGGWLVPPSNLGDAPRGISFRPWSPPGEFLAALGRLTAKFAWTEKQDASRPLRPASPWSIRAYDLRRLADSRRTWCPPGHQKGIRGGGILPGRKFVHEIGYRPPGATTSAW